MEENLKQQTSAITKIAFFGPESTGKTTLAKQLASYYNTNWAPEFARDYLTNKKEKYQQECTIEDMLPIAIGQIALENEATKKANGILFCDTNLLLTATFSELYYKFVDVKLKKATQEHQYDLYFLTQTDVPWQKDGLRNQQINREETYTFFKEKLQKNNQAFIEISGNLEDRLAKAIVIIDAMQLAKKLGFSSHHFVQMYHHGVSVEAIEKQLAFFKNGIPKTNLHSAATIKNGILKLSDAKLKEKAAFFDENKNNYLLEKFVPASGAASRMFKFLNSFLNEYNIENETINAYINRKKDNDLAVFFVGMDKFPFFQEVYKKIKTEIINFDFLDRDHKNYYFIKFLLSSDYFDFANKPKGILPFHKYSATIASPIEEHLYECGYYASANKKSFLHFTVSESHQAAFEKIIASVKDKVENETNNSVSVYYSYQNKNTDTIAVDQDNTPFITNDGKLLLRPGGHGALLDNLNQLKSDIIFIKNIDNVIQNNNDIIALYKKALGGILLEIQLQLFDFLHQLDTNKNKVLFKKIITFLKTNLHINFDENWENLEAYKVSESLKNLLNRPIRVCGMVKNEGEPGGGPFWIKTDTGLSLQIVESSQVDTNNPDQVKIAASATHFNPVDLVCSIKNYKKEPFDLTQFVDPNSGFIVEKNHEGTTIKGYELPGLWNGAMANWISIFVEVPLITFNPVKTVNDLLKAPHQQNKIWKTQY